LILGLDLRWERRLPDRKSRPKINPRCGIGFIRLSGLRLRARNLAQGGPKV